MVLAQAPKLFYIFTYNLIKQLLKLSLWLNRKNNTFQMTLPFGRHWLMALSCSLFSLTDDIQGIFLKCLTFCFHAGKLSLNIEIPNLVLFVLLVCSLWYLKEIVLFRMLVKEMDLVRVRY